jgi:hypothetical protein
MTNYKLWRYDLLSGASIDSDNLGQTPQRAKYRKHFVNLETAEVSQITDLQSRKHKRNTQVEQFVKCYTPLFKKQKISILSFVVKEDKYPTISKFLDMIAKKFNRKGIKKLGHVWVRDVGDILAEKHFHIMIATTRIEPEAFRELFSKKRHSNYDVEFSRNPKGLRTYIKQKELYGSKKKRAFGKSFDYKKAS